MTNCSECGRSFRLPVSLSIKTASCPHCGDMLMRTNDDGWRRMYPALHMRPMRYADDPPIYSKWMPTRTRPVEHGEYDVRFRHTEPNVLRLWWGGGRWYSGEHVVDSTQLLTWRGVLA